MSDCVSEQPITLFRTFPIEFRNFAQPIPFQFSDVVSEIRIPKEVGEFELTVQFDHAPPILLGTSKDGVIQFTRDSSTLTDEGKAFLKQRRENLEMTGRVQELEAMLGSQDIGLICQNIPSIFFNLKQEPFVQYYTVFPRANGLISYRNILLKQRLTNANNGDNAGMIVVFKYMDE